MVAQFPRGLYGITPEWVSFSKLQHAVELAAQGGMVALQWRQKALTGNEAIDKAGQIGSLCKKLGVMFIVNDSVELALAVDADGVHLGRDDDDSISARNRLGPNKIIGVSCYNELARALIAASTGANYVAFGAVYPSNIKPNAVRADLSLFQQARNALSVEATQPTAMVAIGGITTTNAKSVIDAGADSLAVISGLFDAPDILEQARTFAQLFKS